MQLVSILTIIALAAASQDLMEAKTAEEVLAEAERYTVEVEVINAIGLNLDEGGNSTGTGFLVDKERGWLITNAHVATRSPASIEISFNDEKPIEARRIHVDPVIDLAVLEIQASRIPHTALDAPLACEALPAKGAAVLAYGHPKGLKYTGSRGIISGFTDRYLPHSYLMTDAQIDNGSSGGPLIRTDDGRVVGINTASTESEKLSVSFAEPMPAVCRILELLRSGKDAGARHLNIGLARIGGDPLPIVAATYDKQSALKAGDLITHVEESGPINNYADLLDLLRGSGETAMITVERENKSLVVPVRTHKVPDPLVAKAVDIAGLVISEAWFVDEPLVSNSYSLRVHFIDYSRAAGNTEAQISSRVVSVDGKEFSSSEALYHYLNGKTDDHEALIVLRTQTLSDLEYFAYDIIELPVSDVRLLHGGGKAQ